MTTQAPNLGVPRAAMQQDSRDDAGLIEAIANSRDESALTELLRRYERDLYGLALRISARRDRAEEIVQDAMVRVWTSAGTYKRTGAVKSWLLSIVARESIKTIKAMKRKSARMDPNCDYDPENSEPSPLKGAESSELTAALRRACDLLPELERQLIGLHFGGGLTQLEISQALSIPQQTISYRINQSLKLLRANLTSVGYSAAIPILAGSEFADALCSGAAAPTGLREKVLSALAKPRPVHSQRYSRKMTTGKAAASSSLATGTAAVLVAGAVVCAFAVNSAHPPVAKPTAVVQSPAPAPAPVADPTPALAQDPANPSAPVGPMTDWHRRWTFEKGQPADLYLMKNSSWQWNPATKTMDALNEVSFFPAYTLPEQPLLFTIKGKALSLNTTTLTGLTLLKEGKGVPGKMLWEAPTHRFTTVDVVDELYVYHRRVAIAMNGGPGHVFERQVDAKDCVAILMITNLAIQEISVTPLQENEVPDFIKHPESMMKK
jgi:RNA polymerase sigma-70 factor (ECF subfamily)